MSRLTTAPKLNSMDGLRRLDHSITTLPSPLGWTIGAHPLHPSRWLPTDRRERRRYPIALQLDYKLRDRYGGEQRGTGTTVNMSSGGVLFKDSNPLPLLGMIEISLEWPFLLRGTCPLRLRMRGQVVRCTAHEMAVSIESYEFRTAGASGKYCA